MLKLLHTSDIQIGASFRFLGKQGEHHRRQLENTFTRIVQMARDERYNMLLIAGDLFDGHDVDQKTVDFVVRTLGDLSVPVCILPGNHDALTKRSIYGRTTFPPHVHIFTESPTYLDFPELDLTVAGTPLRNSHSTESSLAGIRRTDRQRWFVAMAHGNLQIPGWVENTARPIRPEEIAATGADYVALGDWHGHRDYSQGSVTAWYSGAPEPTGLDQNGAGHVLSVSLSGTGVVVTPVSIGQIGTRSLSIDVGGLDTNALIQQISAAASPYHILSVKLCGLSAVDTFLDVETIRETIGSNCYFLSLTNRTVPALDAITADAYPDNRVIGRYVRLLIERIAQAASEGERQIAEDALQLGVALLNGKEVLR